MTPDASPRSTPLTLEAIATEHEVDAPPESPPVQEEEDDPIVEFEGGCPGPAETKYAVYEFMDNPETLPAHAFSALIMLVIAFSVMTMIVESLPSLTYNDTGEIDEGRKDMFFAMETVCIIIFTLEYVIRFYCVPNKLNFVMQPMNVVDICAIAPYYITMVLSSVVDVSKLRVFRLLRIIRVFRVLKLAKYNRSLSVAIQALTDSTDMFGLMIFMLLVLCILFASFEYNFEMYEPDSVFVSIPAAMWWCIVTVMMVGYGDMFPQTVAGKFVASGCIVVGILIMALPISVIGSNFSRTWEKYEAKMRDEQKLLDAQRVLTPEETESIESRKREEVEEMNTQSLTLLNDFRKCCDQQVKRIVETENKVFEGSHQIWKMFAVDAKRLSTALELWRERAVRETVVQEEERRPHVDRHEVSLLLSHD
jgi:voltage-gated potassium channel Kch